MREGGREGAIELADLAHDTKEVARIEAAAAPRNRMDGKALRFDRGAMPIDARCDMHVEARIASGARHR